MINLTELNLKELLKIIFFMNLEKLLGNKDILTKEYFNLKNYQNLDIIYMQIETNSWNLWKKDTN